MSRVLVTGANGQLGNELRCIVANGFSSDAFFFTDIASDERTFALSVTDLEGIRKFVKENNIDIIVNCAAFTNVDKAEDSFETADLINNKASEYLATVAKEAGAYLIHVSTDYVFDGNNNIPYKESDQTCALGVYGVTKLDGERSVKRVLGKNGNFVIVRTSWLYSSFGNNFVKTIRRLIAEKPQIKVVFDQVGTPTYAADLAEVVYKFIEKAKSGNPCKGVYHFSNEGVCSWYDFAKEIAQLSGNTTCTIEPCHSSEFPSKVNRPHYSVLDKTKIKQTLQTTVPYWRDSLKICISKM